MSKKTHTPTHRLRIKLIHKDVTATATLPMKGSLVAADLAQALRIAAKHVEGATVNGCQPTAVEVKISIR
jgi:hypothetical protein